jgi:hypothetical protein
VGVEGGYEANIIYLHGRGRYYGRPAGARQGVAAPAGDLQRRIDRRSLHHRPGEPRKRRRDRRSVGTHLAFGSYRAFGIVGIGGGAPTHSETVALAAGGDELHRLGRFAERDRQYPGGERVEGSGMPGFCPDSAAELFDDPARGDPGRLVDDQPTAYRRRSDGRLEGRLSRVRRRSPDRDGDPARPPGWPAAWRCARRSRRHCRAQRRGWARSADRVRRRAVL